MISIFVVFFILLIGFLDIKCHRIGSSHGVSTWIPITNPLYVTSLVRPLCDPLLLFIILLKDVQGAGVVGLATNVLTILI